MAKCKDCGIYNEDALAGGHLAGLCVRCQPAHYDDVIPDPNGCQNCGAPIYADGQEICGLCRSVLDRLLEESGAADEASR